MKLKHRDFSLEVKALKSGGLFSGHASLFDEVDSYDEKVARGAFTDTLAEYAAKGRALPVLWQHRTDEPIGVYERVEEDAKGLFVEGRLLVDEVERAREAYSLLKAKAVSGLSIGFYTRESSYDEKEHVRTLTKLDLVEISIVTVPALDSARISDVKQKLANGELPTIRELETSLRDLGFSKSQAAGIVAKGYRSFLRDADNDDENELAAALLQRMRAFSLSK